MYEIFVNYRRSQAVAVAQLVAQLRQHFGTSKVFLDLGMPSGSRYPDELRARIRACEVLLVVIHDRWLAEFTTPRDTDWVREEITTALAMGKPVIPLMLDDTPVPVRRDLHPDIAELAVRNAARVRATHLAGDIDALIRRLEHHVVPETAQLGSSLVVKPARTARRLAGWAAACFLLPLLALYAPGPAWRLFAVPAVGSALVLVISALGSVLLSISLRRLDARTQRRYGALSHREFLARSWLVPAIAVIILAFMLTEGMTNDGGWQRREVWYVIAAVVTTAFYLHRWWRKADLDNRAWPPPVSTDVTDFLRAAHRLHEKLTNDVTWRSPRPLLIRRQAASIYLDLAQVLLALESRARMPLRDWLRNGYSTETTFFLGWLVGLVALYAVALVLRASLDVVSLGFFLVSFGIVAVAALAVGVKAVTAWWGDRKDSAWKIAELTEWQHRLGPQIFCTHD